MAIFHREEKFDRLYVFYFIENVSAYSFNNNVGMGFYSLTRYILLCEFPIKYSIRFAVKKRYVDFACELNKIRIIEVNSL